MTIPGNLALVFLAFLILTALQIHIGYDTNYSIEKMRQDSARGATILDEVTD